MRDESVPLQPLRHIEIRHLACLHQPQRRQVPIKEAHLDYDADRRDQQRTQVEDQHHGHNLGFRLKAEHTHGHGRGALRFDVLEEAKQRGAEEDADEANWEQMERKFRS